MIQNKYQNSPGYKKVIRTLGIFSCHRKSWLVFLLECGHTRKRSLTKGRPLGYLLCRKCLGTECEFLSREEQEIEKEKRVGQRIENLDREKKTEQEEENEQPIWSSKTRVYSR